MRNNNMAVVMQDDDGLFIRSGTAKYRPTPEVTGLRKGSTVKAWPWSGGLKVEVNARHHVWPRAE